jgi:phosphatidylinositol glycan class M
VLARLTHLVHPVATKLVFATLDMVVAAAQIRILRAAHDDVRCSALRYVRWGWVYNPLVVNISTRGSADSLPCALVALATLAAVLSKQASSLRLSLASAVMLGVAVHVKIYPIIYTPVFAVYLCSTPGSRKSLSRTLLSVFSPRVTPPVARGDAR